MLPAPAALSDQVGMDELREMERSRVRSNTQPLGDHASGQPLWSHVRSTERRLSADLGERAKFNCAYLTIAKPGTSALCRRRHDVGVLDLVIGAVMREARVVERGEQDARMLPDYFALLSVAPLSSLSARSFVAQASATAEVISESAFSPANVAQPPFVT